MREHPIPNPNSQYNPPMMFCAFKKKEEL